MNQNNTKHLVLSFDGGGVRLLLQLQIINRLFGAVPNLKENITIYTGSSAGAILSCYLALNKTDAINPSNIFPTNIARSIATFMGLWSSKYSNKGLRTALENIFGSETNISDIKSKIFIPVFKVSPDGENTRLAESQLPLGSLRDEPLASTFAESSKSTPLGDTTLILEGDNTPKWTQKRVERWHPIYIHNLDTTTPNMNLVDVLLKTTAAPYYFPIHNGCIDGGIGNMNPSLAVLTKLLNSGVDINNIYILSIGSGENPTIMNVRSDRDTSYGIAQWLPYLLDSVFDSTSEVTSQALYQILGNRFWRIQPVMDVSISLNDTSEESHQKLIQIGNAFNLTHTIEWLHTIL